LFSVLKLKRWLRLTWSEAKGTATESESARVPSGTESNLLMTERRKVVESDSGLTSFCLLLSTLLSRTGIGDARHASIGGTERRKCCVQGRNGVKRERRGGLASLSANSSPFSTFRVVHSDHSTSIGCQNFDANETKLSAYHGKSGMSIIFLNLHPMLVPVTVS